MNKHLLKAKDFLIDRLKERSTWIALGFILTFCGSKLGADLNWENAQSLGILIAAVIQGLWPDAK